jgi:hypothetical protein
MKTAQNETLAGWHSAVPANGKLAHHPPHPSRAGLLSAETTVMITPVTLDEWHGPAIAFAKWSSRRPF